MSATLPGPGVLTAWLAATVPAPLVFFEWTHRWEEDQPVSTALWWPVLASPVLAAVLAARQPRRPGVALGVSTLVATALLALSLAFFRWVVPLTGEARWGRALLGGAALAVAGALTGYAAGGRLPHRARPASRRGYLIGGLAMVFGALLAQSAVRLGAEDSTTGQPPHEYGGVGPYSTSAGRFTAPAAGAYAIFAVGFSPTDPDCRVTGGGAEVRTAEPVSVPPGDYGSDAAAYSWVATVRVPTPGRWTLDCRADDPEASYVVGAVPEIRGAVGEVIHWQVGVIWLLGAAPGLLIVADTARRRRASHPAVLSAAGNT
ncbi:hypothetical protein ACIBSS_07965 [Micromonospora aurantiaca]|uniref:hypothetical protein n=1 Tax=Micromonospora aurantiaca (nom. illeg.) TaxID=47850 RepID=UPI000F3B9753|nr:hypothetical protein [Micromonospora aurantiaca]RNI00320.1 hypothetical protein EEZ25_20055 [Micromonospora aurantiaca]